MEAEIQTNDLFRQRSEEKIDQAKILGNKYAYVFIYKYEYHEYVCIYT